jgi:hypothetical protein
MRGAWRVSTPSLSPSSTTTSRPSSDDRITLWVSGPRWGRARGSCTTSIRPLIGGADAGPIGGRARWSRPSGPTSRA